MPPIRDADRIRRHIFLPGWHMKDHVYEQMAHAIEHPAPIDCWDLHRTEAFQGELVVSAYVPGERSEHTLKPVLAFGNTRMPGLTLETWENFLSDVTEDLFPVSIGYYRWCYNEGRIVSLIRQLHEEYGPLDVVGHSLGGALAQTCACVRTAELDRVVTFGSPGVGRYVRSKLDPPAGRAVRGTHYHFEGDRIADAGDVFFPGLRPRFTFAERWLSQVARELADQATEALAADPRGRIAGAALWVFRELAATYLAHTAELYEPFYTWRRPPNDRVATARVAERYASLTLHGTAGGGRAFNVLELARMAAGVGHGLTTWALSASDLVDRIRYVVAWDLTKAFLEAFPASHRPAATAVPVPAALLGTDLFSDLAAFRGVQALDNFRQNLELLYPDIPAGPVRIPSGDAHVLITSDGHLTANGIAELRRGWPRSTSGKSDPELDREFFGNPERTGADGRSDWLEWLVGRELKLVHRAENRSGSHNVAESRGTANRAWLLGDFSDRPEDQRSHAEIATVLSVLEELDRARWFRTDESPSQRSTRSALVPYRIPTLDAQRAAEIREMTVYEFLRRRIRRREGRDESLYEAYMRAHRFHLSCGRTDPLRLVRNRALQVACCADRPASYGLDAFARDARRYLQERYEVQAERLDMEKRHHWYTFLFKLLGSDGGRAGHGFVADDHEEIRGCLGTDRPCSEGKRVIRRRPDYVVIIPERRLVTVIDPTFRWRYAYHNFKTEFYASALRYVLPGGERPWQVEAFDYYHAKALRRTSYTA